MEQWISDTQRCDGLYIHKRATEAWSIRTANDALVTDLCPCCGKPFLTARAARLVADFLFPIPANLDDGNPPEAA